MLTTSCLTLEINEFSCGGWWLSGCHGSVAEHWRLKPEVSWVRLLVTAGFFTFLYFRLITSKFIYVIETLNCSQKVDSRVSRMCDLGSLVPRPLPIFLHGCEIKSGSGLGTRL